VIDALRGVVVRATSPLVWRWPGHAPRKLEAFARAEEGSRLDLMAAAHATPSLARRARYLRHALDETRHAAMFTRRARELRASAGLAPCGPPRADTEELFARLGELGFLAFVHLGEQRGRKQFEVYAAHFARRGDARTQAMFDGILVDEREHEGYTHALLVELAGADGARQALRRARWWSAWRGWRRAGRAITHALYAVLMMALYLIMAPLAWLPLKLRGRAARRRWTLDAPPPPSSPRS
jgi:hypothetical protein